MADTRSSALRELSEIHGAAHEIQADLRRHGEPDPTALARLTSATLRLTDLLNTPRPPSAPWHRR